MGGKFQPVTLTAKDDLAAFIPYLILGESGFVHNSTVIDLENRDANPRANAKFPQVFYSQRCSIPTGAPFPKVAHLGLGAGGWGLGAGAGAGCSWAPWARGAPEDAKSCTS